MMLFLLFALLDGLDEKGLCAGVAQPGQRRRTEAPIPQGFVGSNPTPRTNSVLFCAHADRSGFLFGESDFVFLCIRLWAAVTIVLYAESDKTYMILGIVVVAILLVGTGWTLFSIHTPSGSTEKTKIVVDSRGKSVNITSDVQRIVVLRSGIIETLFALGAQDKIVGIDESTKAGTGYGAFPVKLDANITSLPCPVNKDPNIEQIVALNPDVILIGGYGRIRLANRW
jgi:hypothetical protein